MRNTHKHTQDDDDVIRYDIMISSESDESSTEYEPNAFIKSERIYGCEKKNRFNFFIKNYLI